MKDINILHINHISRTWSGNVMRTIIQWLSDNIFNSHILVGYDFDSCENTDSVYKTSKSIFYRQIRYKFFVGLNFLFDFMTPGCITINFLEQYKYYQQADIIHIHCPQWGYLNWYDLPEIAKEKKIILTIHDDRITSGNDAMNLYYPYKRKRQFNIRNSIFKRCTIDYIWVSNRCTNKIIKSWIAADNKVKTIYNGIDVNNFCIQDKISARKKLWLPLDKKIVLSLAGSWSKTNMKWLWFVTQIQKQYSKKDDILFLTLWNEEERKVSDTLREFWYLCQSLVALYFSAVDCFLYPTLMDSFGLVIAESLSCWCPVVTFDVWWVPEIVQHKVNGYIAKYKDYDDLLKGFERVIDNRDSLVITLDKKFTQENMVKQYVELYKSLM